MNFFKGTHQKYHWKKMWLLTKEELKSHQDAKVYFICEKDSWKNLLMIKIIGKLEIIATIQVNIEAQHIAFVIQNLMFPMNFL